MISGLIFNDEDLKWERSKTLKDVIKLIEFEAGHFDKAGVMAAECIIRQIKMKLNVRSSSDE